MLHTIPKKWYMGLLLPVSLISSGIIAVSAQKRQRTGTDFLGSFSVETFDNNVPEQALESDDIETADAQPINGGWSEWSPWSECQTTCGSGIRTSNRWCNHPAPQNGGKDCSGLHFRTEPCSIKVHCPINGGWSDWAPWSCSVSCGGGAATRSRKCNKPKPFYGGVCIGNATEYAGQPCNAFTCPPSRKISDETKKLLGDIKKDLFIPTSMVKEGTRVAKVQCASKLLLDNLIWELKLSVRHAVQWLRNGHPWKVDKSRTEKSMFALGFNRVAASDTGFYSCELDLLGGGKRLLKAFSLIVLSNKTNMEVSVNKPFELECNSLALGSLYPNARISWYFNDTLYRSFNDTPAVLTNALRFPHAVENMTGDWECFTYEIYVKPDVEREEKTLFQKVKDKVMGRTEATDKPNHPKILNPLMRLVPTPPPVPKVIPGQIWMTNKIRVRVNPPPSLADLVRTPHFMGLCTGVGLLAFVTIIALVKGKANDVMDSAQEKVHKFAEIKRTSRILSEASILHNETPINRLPEQSEDDMPEPKEHSHILVDVRPDVTKLQEWRNGNQVSASQPVEAMVSPHQYAYGRSLTAHPPQNIPRSGRNRVAPSGDYPLEDMIQFDDEPHGTQGHY